MIKVEIYGSMKDGGQIDELKKKISKSITSIDHYDGEEFKNDGVEVSYIANQSPTVEEQFINKVEVSVSKDLVDYEDFIENFNIWFYNVVMSDIIGETKIPFKIIAEE